MNAKYFYAEGFSNFFCFCFLRSYPIYNYFKFDTCFLFSYFIPLNVYVHKYTYHFIVIIYIRNWMYRVYYFWLLYMNEYCVYLYQYSVQRITHLLYIHYLLKLFINSAFLLLFSFFVWSFSVRTSLTKTLINTHNYVPLWIYLSIVI